MVTMKEVQFISNRFCIESAMKSIEPLESGHINDTFLIVTNNDERYVLQKMNTNVFSDVESVIENKVNVSKHLLKAHDFKYETITFIETKGKEYHYMDGNGDYWNMMSFIPNSHTVSIPNSAKLVFEAGKLYGDFISKTATLPANCVKETLPDFHDVPLRFSQFEIALENASESNKEKAKEVIEFAYKSRDEMFKLSALKNEDVFPIRIVHNDAKLSNILFDDNDEGLAVIDLDTVMPGIVHFDFGDSIRSICTNTVEDDENFESISIKLDYYEAFCNGYALSTRDILTPQEVEYLPLGAKTIIFIMGLRFLTDFLNGNIYYKVKYDTHNLVRCKNQFKLLESVQSHYDEILRITYDAYALDIS